MYTKIALVLIATLAFSSNGFGQGQEKEVKRLPIAFTAEDLVLLLSKANGSESRPGIDFDLVEPVIVSEKIQFSFNTDDPRVANLVDQFVAELSRLNRDKQSGAATQLTPNPITAPPRSETFNAPPSRGFEGGTGRDPRSQQQPTEQDDSSAFPGAKGASVNSDTTREFAFGRENAPNNGGFGSRGPGLLPSSGNQLQPTEWNGRSKTQPQESTDGFRTTGIGTSTYAQIPPQRTAGISSSLQFSNGQPFNNSQAITQLEIDRLVDEEIQRRGLIAARAKAQSQVPSFAPGLPGEIPGQTPLGQSNLGSTGQDTNRQMAFIWFMLLFSIALNFYLAFLARSFYTRYQDLADELRETFTSST
jgi:hypothetical protein